MAVSQVKSVPEREITCSLCLGIFQEPKKLPCDHVFCKGCLEMRAMARRIVTHAIVCPECWGVAHLPNGLVEDLPTDLHVKRLIDAFQEVRDREQEDAAWQAVLLTDCSPVAKTATGLPTSTGARGQSQRERYDIFRSGSQTSEWQRMRAVREREQHATAERPRKSPGDSGGTEQRAATFSQFFSQLKTEWNVLVRGIKQFGRSQSRENRYL